MTVKEANSILDLVADSPGYSKPFKLNKVMTVQQAAGIVRAAINDRSPAEDSVLSEMLEKRVHQVSKNQKRPRY